MEKHYLFMKKEFFPEIFLFKRQFFLLVFFILIFFTGIVFSAAPSCPDLGLKIVSASAVINEPVTKASISFSCKDISPSIPSGDKVIINRIDFFDASRFLVKSVTGLSVECSKDGKTTQEIDLDNKVPASFSFTLFYGGTFSGNPVSCTKSSSVSTSAVVSETSIPDLNAFFSVLVVFLVSIIISIKRK